MNTYHIYDECGVSSPHPHQSLQSAYYPMTTLTWQTCIQVRSSSWSSKFRRFVHQRHTVQQSELLDADQIPSHDLRIYIVQHHTPASIYVSIKLYTDHVMSYNLDHAEDIDQCVPVFFVKNFICVASLQNSPLVGNPYLPRYEILNSTYSELICKFTFE